MKRTIMAIVAGYLAMACVVGLAFAVVFVAPGLAFLPGRCEVTPFWCAFTLAASLVAAILGGWTARRIARDAGRFGSAGTFLAILTLVLGGMGAAGQLASSDPPPAEPTAVEVERMSTFERASHCREPRWYSMTVPLVGAAGILAGAWRRKREGGTGAED